MNTTFTTINGTTFTANETMTHCYCWPEGRKGERVRIKKAEFEAAQREDELERKMAAEQETTELVLTENDNMVTITPEDIERDARELERYLQEQELTETMAELGYHPVDGSVFNDIRYATDYNEVMAWDTVEEGLVWAKARKAEESNTDLEVAEIAEQMLDAAAEDPKVSLEEFVEKVEKVEKAKKARKSKDIAFTYAINGEVIVTLTAKQVDFIKHLPDTCFWERGLDSCIWIDCLCDEIKGQFQGKPMTVGAMISTICEKGLGVRADNRVNGKKCKSFALTELGKQVFANPEWGLN